MGHCVFSSLNTCVFTYYYYFLVFFLMIHRSSLHILGTEALLVYRMSAKKAASSFSHPCRHTLPSSRAGVYLSSDWIGADPVSCLNQKNTAAVMSGDLGLRPSRDLAASISPSWEPAAMWKILFFWRGGHVEREALQETVEGKRPRQASAIPTTSIHTLYIWGKLSWKFQPQPSSQLDARVTSADASGSRRTAHLSSAQIPDPQSHGQ